MAPCPSCSLKIRVIFTEAELPPLPDEDDEGAPGGAAEGDEQVKQLVRGLHGVDLEHAGASAEAVDAAATAVALEAGGDDEEEGEDVAVVASASNADEEATTAANAEGKRTATPAAAAAAVATPVPPPPPPTTTAASNHRKPNAGSADSAVR